MYAVPLASWKKRSWDASHVLVPFTCGVWRPARSEDEFAHCQWIEAFFCFVLHFRRRLCPRCMLLCRQCKRDTVAAAFACLSDALSAEPLPSLTLRIEGEPTKLSAACVLWPGSVSHTTSLTIGSVVP